MTLLSDWSSTLRYDQFNCYNIAIPLQYYYSSSNSTKYLIIINIIMSNAEYSWCKHWFLYVNVHHWFYFLLLLIHLHIWWVHIVPLSMAESWEDTYCTAMRCLYYYIYYYVWWCICHQLIIVIRNEGRTQKRNWPLQFYIHDVASSEVLVTWKCYAEPVMLLSCCYCRRISTQNPLDLIADVFRWKKNKHKYQSLSCCV